MKKKTTPPRQKKRKEKTKFSRENYINAYTTQFSVRVEYYGNDKDKEQRKMAGCACERNTMWCNKYKYTQNKTKPIDVEISAGLVVHRWLCCCCCWRMLLLVALTLN